MVTTLLRWTALAAGAGCGAVLRFLVDATVTRLFPHALPVGTMAVNLSGAFALGLLDGVTLPAAMSFVFGTGVIGAYTTFSTWMFETQRLAEERRSAVAAANVGLSLALGVAAGALGLWLGGGL
ncbi:MAG TPA: fluoride efflux transporter CrcB [Nocardioides sp.]|jgi:CrcB protein|nr:fluoride efflux transporter CrcB [Nocardioides sp.]